MGLQFPCLYTQQVIDHVDCLLRHGGTSSILGQLLDATIKRAKVEIGVAGQLFRCDFHRTGFLLTNSWVKQVWKEVQEYELEVNECSSSRYLHRTNDQFIMTAFMDHGYSKSQLLTLNKCRLYLRVLTLADMVSGDGWYILPHFFRRINPLEQYSSIRWPEQGCPTDSAWLLWTQALRKSFPQDRSSRLVTPLGEWTHFDKQWGSFYDWTTRSLYIQHRGQWQIFRQNNATFTGPTSGYSMVDRVATVLISTISHIAVAWYDGTTLHTHGIGRYNPTKQQPKAEWYFEWLDTIGDNQVEQIAKAIQEKTAIALTDGSYKVNGTAGFSLGSSFSNMWQGACRVPGHITSQGAYRSEIAGI